MTFLAHFFAKDTHRQRPPPLVDINNAYFDDKLIPFFLRQHADVTCSFVVLREDGPSGPLFKLFENMTREEALKLLLFVKLRGLSGTKFGKNFDSILFRDAWLIFGKKGVCKVRESMEVSTIEFCLPQLSDVIVKLRDWRDGEKEMGSNISVALDGHATYGVELKECFVDFDDLFWSIDDPQRCTGYRKNSKKRLRIKREKLINVLENALEGNLDMTVTVDVEANTFLKDAYYFPTRECRKVIIRFVNGVFIFADQQHVERPKDSGFRNLTEIPMTEDAIDKCLTNLKAFEPQRIRVELFNSHC